VRQISPEYRAARAGWSRLTTLIRPTTTALQQVARDETAVFGSARNAGQATVRLDRARRHGPSAAAADQQISGVDVSSKIGEVSFGARDTLKVGADSYDIYRLDAVRARKSFPTA